MIVVDPGHGGARPDFRPGLDRGLRVEGVRECHLVMLYASELVCALSARGVSGWLTRTGDSLSLSLEDRVRLANGRKAKAFVSVHCAASPNPDAAGLQVFHARGDARSEQLARAVHAAAVPAVAEDTPRSGVFADQTVHCGYTAPAQAFAQQLAEREWWRVDERVRERFGSHAPYRKMTVLRQLEMPAVLVKLDYLTCAPSRQRLLDDVYRRRLAAAIADGIDGWLWPAPTSTA